MFAGHYQDLLHVPYAARAAKMPGRHSAGSSTVYGLNLAHISLFNCYVSLFECFALLQLGCQAGPHIFVDVGSPGGLINRWRITTAISTMSSKQQNKCPYGMVQSCQSVGQPCRTPRVEPVRCMACA